MRKLKSIRGRRFALVLLFCLGGCQTAQEKREHLVETRVRQFKSLSHFAPMRCLVLAHLTEPAHARYQEMFPGTDFDRRALTYDYRVSPSACAIAPVEPGNVTRNYQGFLQTAFCVLLQAHWVNSPFDGLAYQNSDLEARGEQVHVRTTGSGDLGLYLAPEKLEIETRTRARGVFRAAYLALGAQVIPTRLELRQIKSVLVMDQIQFDPSRGGGARPLLRSFDVAVGEKDAVAQAHVELTDCRLDP